MTRSCGDCSECCRLLEITADRAPEIGNKPAGETCRYCAKPGCGIYDRRPKLCADFRCQWLADERLGPEWFPPVAGMILSFDDQKSVLFVITDPDRPDAHRAQPYAYDIARMESWGKKSPTPFEVRIAAPPQPASSTRQSQ
jgi:hypothetical protein